MLGNPLIDEFQGQFQLLVILGSDGDEDVDGLLGPVGPFIQDYFEVVVGLLVVMLREMAQGYIVV